MQLPVVSAEDAGGSLRAVLVLSNVQNAVTVKMPKLNAGLLPGNFEGSPQPRSRLVAMASSESERSRLRRIPCSTWTRARAAPSIHSMVNP
jgi:hypothetical protein